VGGRKEGNRRESFVHDDYPKSRPQHFSYLYKEILINRKISFFFFFQRPIFTFQAQFLLGFFLKEGLEIEREFQNNLKGYFETVN